MDGLSEMDGGGDGVLALCGTAGGEKGLSEEGIEFCRIGRLLDSSLRQSYGFGKVMLTEQIGGRQGVRLRGEQRDVKGTAIDKDDVADRGIGLCALIRSHLWSGAPAQRPTTRFVQSLARLMNCRAVSIAP